MLKTATIRLFMFTLILISAASANFEVSPFVLVLRADKGEMTGWFELKPNQDKRPVAVELSLFERKLDLNGIELQETPESQNLTIYPSELVIFPGEKKKIQVIWSGKTIPTFDQTYTVLAKEIPIDLNKSESKDKLDLKINTMVRYRLVVAVETGKRGNLSVVSTKKLGKNEVEIVVENKGAGRIPMDGFHLLIGGKKYDKFAGIGNSIMPAERRRFVLEMERNLSPSDIRFGAADMPIK